MHLPKTLLSCVTSANILAARGLGAISCVRGGAIGFSVTSAFELEHGLA